MSSNRSSIIYRKLSLSTLQLAVCEVTGLSISLNVPAIPNMALTYQNPFALFANAHKVADLPYKDQCRIHPTILAGCLLTLLNHYELIQDHLSSLERNIILSSVPIHTICSAMRMIITSSKLRLRAYPHISLDQPQELYSSQQDILKNWIEVCEKPFYFERTTVESTHVISDRTPASSKQSKNKKATLSSSARKTIKTLIDSTISTETLSPKLCTLLKLLGTGNNLIEMHASMKDKLVDKLYNMTSESAHSLAEFIVSLNTNTEETIEEDISESAISDIVPSTVKKLSLKEILASKLSGKHIPEAKETIEVRNEDSSATTFLSALKEANNELSEEEIEEEIDTDFVVESSFDPDEF